MGDASSELRHLAAAYAVERVAPFEDVTGLASALVRRYLLGLGDSLDGYAASWDASREDPDGCTWPEWAALGLDVRARYVGLEIAQCTVAMLDQIASSETDIHDVIPDVSEIGRLKGGHMLDSRRLVEALLEELAIIGSETPEREWSAPWLRGYASGVANAASIALEFHEEAMAHGRAGGDGGPKREQPRR